MGGKRGKSSKVGLLFGEEVMQATSEAMAEKRSASPRRSQRRERGGERVRESVIDSSTG